MTLSLTPLGEALGIAADGVDLRVLLDAASGDALRRALLDHLVLCIRDQVLTPAAFREAMRSFGIPVPQVRAGARHPEVAEIMILSSEDRDGRGDGQRIRSEEHT